MNDTMSLDELVRLNPHLDRAEIERLLEKLQDKPVKSQRQRRVAPDRLRVGDPTRARKVRLRYNL
jgi:hypothetical protein